MQAMTNNQYQRAQSNLVEWKVDPNVRSLIQAEGAILFDLSTGRCHSLNPIGAQIWQTLAGNEASTFVQLVSEICSRTELVNASVETDVAHFLNELEQRSLVTRMYPERGEVAARKTSRCVSTLNDKSVPERAPLSHDSEAHVRPITSSAAAFVLLIMVGLVLRILGFSHLYRLTQRWPIRNVRSTDLDLESAKRLCSLVDHVGAFYYKHAWCLQRATATTCFLRLNGYSAQTVVGFRKIPFEAHAWVEVHGAVVNDHPKVNRFYHAVVRW